MRRDRIDLFHALFVPPPFTSVPYAFTMHGSEVLARPKFYPLALRLRIQFLFRRAIKNARLIFCVSNFVRNYLEKEHCVSSQRLVTTYLGCDFCPIDQPSARAQVAAKFNLSEPYILAVCRIEPRKNPIALLRAYEQFRRTASHPPKLVFAAMKTWSGKEFDQTVRDLSLQSHIIELGHVERSSLPALYSAAEFTVFPSLWEGFGLPALEAMACGSPLVTSDNTSLPEVTGDAALLVDATSIDSISAGLRRMHEDDAFRARMKAQGLKQAQRFSWEATARQCLAGYELIGANGERTNHLH
jgi:glycosyltransferase involved in cell wall biosynthesis